MRITRHILSALCSSLLLVNLACSDEKEVVVKEGTVTIPSEFRTINVKADDQKADIKFSATGDWTLGALDDASWLKFNATASRSDGVKLTNSISGKAGDYNLTIWLEENVSEQPRTGKVRFMVGNTTSDITVTQEGKVTQDAPKPPSPSESIDPSTIPDYDKFFPNSEYGKNILKPNAKFSFARYKSSEHFFVFWDKYFGDDPNSSELKPDDRVDVDDLLAKAEQFFTTNIEKLGLAVLGQGKSYLDDYKMQIYLLDPTPEWWVATGSGYDDVIGALWVTPSTCQPVGSTIAHEIGHSFQYQTYCDKVYQGSPNDYLSGWRYGFAYVNNPLYNNTGGCGYWEQCAQWQSFQDYPEEQFTSYNFQEWINNSHRHFHHEWQRYASYWLQSYWVAKHGVEIYGRLWRESEWPEDAIMAYTRIANGGDWSVTREELFDYAARVATFDIDYSTITPYAASYQGVYSTSMLKNGEGMYQPTYSNCPGATGFNVITLVLPEEGDEVAVNFKGLEYGAQLLEADAGYARDGDGNPAKKVTAYNKVGGAENMGWRYGFVAYSNGKRTYSEVGKDSEGTLSFKVPSGTTDLYLVVQGSPADYTNFRCPWDDDETNDAQFPYAVSFVNTKIKGMIDIDDSSEPENIDLEISRSYKLADMKEYELETIDLIGNGMAEELCQAFVLNSSEFASAVLPIASGKTAEPTEGKIAFGLTQPDGKTAYTYTANGGFYITDKGYLGSWGDSDPMWVEYAPDTFKLTLGQYPGMTEKGTYVYKPTFTYIKSGKTYNAVITVTVKFE